MPGIIPATGLEVAMGKVYAAFAGGPYPPTTPNISLNAVLAPYASISAGTSTSLSSSFGGKSTPNTYP